MVNLDCISNFDADELQLQKSIIFWICVANRPADVVDMALDIMFSAPDLKRIRMPFDILKVLSEKEIARRLKEVGIGCYTTKAKGLSQIANSNIDLRNCTADELEEIHGIGMKTSRCFILHSRPNARYAGLDTHILKFLKSEGYDVPQQTPGSKKKYKELEKIFINIADELNLTPAQLDFQVWEYYYNQRRGK